MATWLHSLAPGYSLEELKTAFSHKTCTETSVASLFIVAPSEEIVQNSLLGERVKQTGKPRQKTLTQFRAVARSCPTLCHPVDCSTPGGAVDAHCGSDGTLSTAGACHVNLLQGLNVTA